MAASCYAAEVAGRMDQSPLVGLLSKMTLWTPGKVTESMKEAPEPHSLLLTMIIRNNFTKYTLTKQAILVLQ